jgi:hypothetical protein
MQSSDLALVTSMANEARARRAASEVTSNRATPFTSVAAHLGQGQPHSTREEVRRAIAGYEIAHANIEIFGRLIGL